MKKVVAGLLLIVVIFGSFVYGLYQGRKGYAFNVKDFKVEQTATSTSTFSIVNDKNPTKVDYNLLWDAISVVKKNYIEDVANDQQILYGATRGAVAAMGDQYTQYFDPKSLDGFRTDLKGSFFGIGAEVGLKNDAIVIIAPLDDSPAAKAGIRAGDYILEVDGKSTTGWSVEQAVDKIRGDKGTEVKLTLFRSGKSQPIHVSITRDEIKIKSVKTEIKTVGNKKIGVIHLSRFGDDTIDLFNDAVRQMQAEKVSGVVVDLRNDPGGYLETAVDVASHWLPKSGLVVSEVSRDTSRNKKYESAGYAELAKIKTVVLINGGSASAAEILSGALKDSGFATLIGEKSFGKGSVQQLIDLPEGGAVKVTIAKWVTPSGVNLNKNGLNPDIEVKITEDDINNKKDPQMDKALEEAAK